MTTIHPRNESTNRFPLFEEIFGNVNNQKIFDFGGSSGNLLYFSNGKISENNYTCVDISREAINSGMEEFPNASWIHYDRFNWMYNEHGNPAMQFPNVDKSQDIIWAYSVFSHVDAEEFIKTIEWFQSFNYKKLAVSFLDINGDEIKQYFYNKRVKDYGSCNSELLSLSSKDGYSAYFFDNSDLEVNKYKCKYIPTKHFLSFFDTDWLLTELNSKGIEASVVRPGNTLIPFLIIERKI